MIPKTIHQFNIENSDQSTERINRIRDQHKKAWSHMLWKLEDVKKLYPYALDNFKNKFEFFLEKGMYKKAEDIAKFLILKVHGGVYIDDGFILLKGKSIDSIPFKDNNLVLFNSIYRRKDLYRLQETIIASEPNHPFIIHLLDYIGQKNYLPRCPFDGKILDVYSAGYITNHYLLYNRLYNNLPPQEKTFSRINANHLSMLEKEMIFDPKYVCRINQSMILKHNIVSKRCGDTAEIVQK